jgi:ribonuclease HI
MAKRKYYVVWEGRSTGIFDSWAECLTMVQGYNGAKYKSFATREEACEAYRREYWDVVKGVPKVTKTAPENLPQGIAVDAACSGNPGRMEYRGVSTSTGKELFHQGIFEDSTNNIGEFLAIVHGLSYLKTNNIDCPLYSDSVSAISWVRNKKCKTKLLPTDKNAKSFELIARAERWLQTNEYSTRIIKWDTEHWGEIPADFGRK